jgi:hypothetical protein
MARSRCGVWGIVSHECIAFERFAKRLSDSGRFRSDSCKGLLELVAPAVLSRASMKIVHPRSVDGFRLEGGFRHT